MDVHRDFCEVAIAEAGAVRSGGRIETSPEALELFAASLARADVVALEVTGNAGEIARILRPHVGAVVVVSPHDTGISRARAKTDRLDARVLAKLLAAGELDAVWMPDEWTRAMRRRLARRDQLVRARTRAKNEIHAVLIRRLAGRPPVSDVFGVRGRRWLSELELPEDERETVAGCLRHVDFLDGEVAALDGAIASEALRKPEVLRLMTVPGVSVVTASTFVAAICDIRRFSSARKLVGYLGLDPRVRQSGPGPARHGRITKQGSASVRHVLVEAVWTAVRSPGPMRAFYERVRARRGAQVAAVATARKLSTGQQGRAPAADGVAAASPSLPACLGLYERVRQHWLDAFEDVRLDPKEALDLVRFESGSRQPTDHRYRSEYHSLDFASRARRPGGRRPIASATSRIASSASFARKRTNGFPSPCHLPVLPASFL